MIETFITLIAGHALADFALQTDAIATGKNRNIDQAKFGVPWWYWLSAHAAIHGLVVGIATGNTWLGFAEFACHWLIDLGKCEKTYGIHTDQMLHMICKAGWSVLA